MKYLISLLFLVVLSHSAKAEDFNVLWEMDFSSFASSPIVSDDGKYFYYCDSGYVKFHESDNGSLLNKFPDRRGLLNSYDTYLNNDRVLLLFSLDSIMIYNIATNIAEEIINLNYNSDSTDFFRYVLSPNKRYLSILCKLGDDVHIIIVDLEQKKLYKDVILVSTVGQIFSTNDPDRMIVVTKNQFGSQLMEIRIDGSEPFGYKRNIFEEVDTDGAIRGHKYDADEDAFYYLSLPGEDGDKLLKYTFSVSKKTILLDWGQMNNVTMWYSDDNYIFVSEKGYIRNLQTDESIVFVELPPDGKQHILSSCGGLETILLRDYVTSNVHKLRRLDVDDFLTEVEIDNPINNFLYPNPTSGILNISLSNQFPSFFNYSIISVSGQIIISDELGFLQPNQNNLNINVGSIPIGHYTLRIFSEQEEFKFNIIKEG